MTREEEIAKEAYLVSNNGDEYTSFIQGAEWADKSLKEKLNEFLENTDFEIQYLDDIGFFDKGLFIKDINSILNE